MSSRIYSVSKTYSLTMSHIIKVVDMASGSGQSQGEVVREAIDLLYTQKVSVSGAAAPIQETPQKTLS